MIASAEIATFTAGLSREDFDQQRGTQLIVERLIITVGEALAQAERSFEDLEKIIPELSDIVGMRNHLVHGYRDIDVNVVWNVVVRRCRNSPRC